MATNVQQFLANAQKLLVKSGRNIRTELVVGSLRETLLQERETEKRIRANIIVEMQSGSVWRGFWIEGTIATLQSERSTKCMDLEQLAKSLLL